MPSIGYARVSTIAQDLAAQLDQLQAQGCATIYRETASGARSDRRELRRALDALQPGDVLTVTRLDRLARSTRDLLDLVETIATRGAALRSLGEAWADTNTPAGRLMLTVLAGLAEFERHLILSRTAEGRARAKKDGRPLGRRPSMTAHQIAEARRMAETMSDGDIARIMGKSRSTISRTLNRKAASLASRLSPSPST